MKKSLLILIAAASAPFVLLAAGFLIFAESVLRDPANPDVKADGIVVLTGGPARISEGARLLRDGQGRRLLISGVNQQAGRESLMRLSGLDAATFDCCVDLGYEALDTVGNADETRNWAQSRGYETLVIVTSSYHMPRSLVELARAMPDIELVPHAIPPKRSGGGPWWLEQKLTRELAREYLKFLPAAARLVATRLAGAWTPSSIATVSDDLETVIDRR